MKLEKKLEQQRRAAIKKEEKEKSNKQALEKRQGKAAISPKKSVTRNQKQKQKEQQVEEEKDIKKGTKKEKWGKSQRAWATRVYIAWRVVLMNGEILYSFDHCLLDR